MQVIQAIADAQIEYSTVDWDEDGMLEYAPRFASTKGSRDGLYWPAEGAEYESPLGSLVAKADGLVRPSCPQASEPGRGIASSCHTPPAPSLREARMQSG